METRQLNHQEIQNKHLNHSIVVVAENLKTPENIGMAFRIGEAMGIKKLFFCGEAALFSPKARKCARSTDKWLDYQFIEEMEDILAILEKEGYALIGLEITNKSAELRNYDFSKHSKIALFIGSEKNGISQTTLNALQTTVHIPMFGKNTSINVINALAIGLYEISKQ